MNLSDDAAVHKTLNALAGKLYYDAAATERHLKGKAMIAEGLTASSASKKLEDITFKANGQGSVKEDIGEGRQIAEGDWKGAVRERSIGTRRAFAAARPTASATTLHFLPSSATIPSRH